MIYEIKDGLDGGHLLRCPRCRKWGLLDDDQWNGKVSVLCDCGFHQTMNLAAMTAKINEEQVALKAVRRGNHHE